MLAGIGAFALHRSQPTHAEYLWLGLYLFLLGLPDMLWGCQVNGLLPISANNFIAIRSSTPRRSRKSSSLTVLAAGV